MHVLIEFTGGGPLSVMCARCGCENNTDRYDVCPDCLTDKERRDRVIQYLMSNRNSNAMNVANNTGIPLRIIMDMINAGQLRSGSNS